MSIEITDWLRGLGLEQYAAAFRDNDIDAAVLQRLTVEDLRELGVASIGHRRRLLDAIAALGAAAAVRQDCRRKRPQLSRRRATPSGGN
jgi:SAM domain (Sterile alpha motif)